MPSAAAKRAHAEVDRADRVGADGVGDRVEHALRAAALSTVSAISASPPCAVRLTWAPAMLTPASPSARADQPDDAGPVVVAEEHQVLARR